MNFKKNKFYISTPWLVVGASLVWLIIISGLHFWLNVDHGKRRIITMGYMPVITNLAAPLLDYATRDGNGVRFNAMKFESFADMAESLRNGGIQVAFMIAPLSIVLRQQGEDVKVIYIGNRHESTLVVKKSLHVTTLAGLAGRTVAVPIRYSMHNLCLRKLMEEKGLSGRIKIVEMNPPDMAAAMTTGSLDAYFVGEPFAAQTIKNADADVLYYGEDILKNFICNLMLVQKKFIDDNPEITKLLVRGAVRSGLWAKKNTQKAAKIAAQYWHQPVDLIEYALTTPKNRIVYDQFLPKQSEMQQMADLMVHFGLIKNNNISGLVDDKFAKNVDLSGITDVNSILGPSDSK